MLVVVKINTLTYVAVDNEDAANTFAYFFVFVDDYYLGLGQRRRWRLGGA